MFNVIDFGAVPDGETDCTASFQKAIDAAGEVRGTVIVPPGTYVCDKLVMRPQTGIQGYPSYSYKEWGGSVINLRSPENDCLIDVTHASGARIKGLCLNGQSLGEDVCGVLVNKAAHGEHEDTIFIEDCKIGRFTGDGVRLLRIWVFTLRHNMVCFNKGNGLYFVGWDGFILDNWLSGNRGCGVFGDDCASVTCTANRIEWNKNAIRIKDGCTWNITGNYIDRSGQAGIWLGGGSGVTHNIVMTGNVIFRSGAWRERWPEELSEHYNAHVYFERCVSVVFSSNTMYMGRDDFGKGVFSPYYGIVYKQLKNSVIKDNVGQDACIKEFVVDLGGHGEGVKVADNFGGPAKDIENYSWMEW